MLSQFNQSNEEVKKVTVARDEWIEKYRKLESNIESKDKAYKVLQDTYNEVFAEKEKITKQYKEQEKFETEVINVKVPELEERLKNTENAYKELQDKYKENDIARGEAELRLENIQKEYTDKFKEQEEKYNKLDKLYDDCENEKLAAQADYDSLKEKYESLKINAEANEEVARKYEDLYEEYETLKSKESADKELLKFNKDDINSLCDTILDFFKDKNLNKE